MNENEKYINEVYGGLVSDTEGKIPKDIGEMLVKENSDPNYTILIHRTSSISSDEAFKNGILNAAGTNLDKTTDRYKDNMSLLISVRESYGYKNYYGKGSRCIVMKVPNTALKYTKGVTKPILMQTDYDAMDGSAHSVGEKQTIILPEYILGSVEFDGDKMTEFVQNPGYKEVHDYKNNGLVCPSETIYSYMKEKNFGYEYDLQHMGERNAIINSIINEENSQYMENPKTQTPVRLENELKSYAKQGLLKSTFNKMSQKIKDFFSRDNTKDKSVDQYKSDPYTL